MATLVLSGATTVVLLGYQALRQPDVSHLAQGLPELLFRSVLAGGLIFSLVNALLEELMCRWVLYDAVAAEWGVIAAVVITSAFLAWPIFRAIRLVPWGGALAGLYGVGLGACYAGGAAVWHCLFAVTCAPMRPSSGSFASIDQYNNRRRENAARRAAARLGESLQK